MNNLNVQDELETIKNQIRLLCGDNFEHTAAKEFLLQIRSEEDFTFTAMVFVPSNPLAKGSQPEWLRTNASSPVESAMKLLDVMENRIRAAIDELESRLSRSADFNLDAHRLWQATQAPKT
jgi:hypothetical protein